MLLACIALSIHFLLLFNFEIEFCVLLCMLQHASRIYGIYRVLAALTCIQMSFQMCAGGELHGQLRAPPPAIRGGVSPPIGGLLAGGAPPIGRLSGGVGRELLGRKLRRGVRRSKSLARNLISLRTLLPRIFGRPARARVQGCPLGSPRARPL